MKLTWFTISFSSTILDTHDIIYKRNLHFLYIHLSIRSMLLKVLKLCCTAYILQICLSQTIDWGYGKSEWPLCPATLGGMRAYYTDMGDIIHHLSLLQLAGMHLLLCMTCGKMNTRIPCWTLLTWEQHDCDVLTIQNVSICDTIFSWFHYANQHVGNYNT